eukprot:gene13273-8484_t
MADPAGLRAAHVFGAPGALARRFGARAGDWVIYELPADERVVQRGALQRIRSRAHAELLVTKQWLQAVRVRGGALDASLWGGDHDAVLEVTPPGAARATAHHLRARDWVANVGDSTAYVQLLPATARRPIPERYLEIPPHHKAVLLIDADHAIGGAPLEVRRAVGMPMLRDEELHRPNVDETSLIWYTAAAPAPQQPAPAAPPTGLPRLGSINVAGTIGGAGERRAAQRLGELADMARHHRIGVLFCVSCGPRQPLQRLPGRPWQVRWSQAGGSDQEGVCALVHGSVKFTEVHSEHHNVLSLRLPPAGAPPGVRSFRDVLATGCYAVGSPAFSTGPAADGRWPNTMSAVGEALRKHGGPSVVLGDFNARDPAAFLGEAPPQGEGEAAFAEWLDVTNHAVAPAACDIPTWLGAGEEGVRARRIDHVLGNPSADRLELKTEVVWCLRWVVDHALIFTDLQGGHDELPEPHRWRSVEYNTRDPAALLEFTQTAALFTRHATVGDPVSQFDAALRRAAHAALGRSRVSRASSRTPAGADGVQGNSIAEWIGARCMGAATEHLEVDEDHVLEPSADPRADARRAYDLLRELRSAARNDVRINREAKRDEQREWEAECVASSRGTTQRLLRKPGLTVISVVEDADGITYTGAALPQAVWEQSRGMREDGRLRAETLSFLRNFEGDRVGIPLSARDASSLLWGLNCSAPGVDQVSARMLRHLEAWATDTWLMWIAKQNQWRRDLAEG